MNQKTAKLFRKLATKMFETSQVENKQLHEYDEDRNKAKISYKLKQDVNGVNIVDENNNPQIEPVFVSRGQLTNSPTSLRGIYRKMKKDYRLGIQDLLKAA